MSFWENFWSFIWLFFWGFAFVAYLMALFSIIGDIFRDHKLGGFAKAVWLLFLIFAPFITALVYLIARGGGMAERQLAAVKNNQAAAENYIKEVAGHSAADEIAKAKALLDAGTISADEFASIKAKALAHA